MAQDNTGLYIGIGVGIAALLGAALLSGRKKPSSFSSTSTTEPYKAGCSGCFKR